MHRRAKAIEQELYKRADGQASCAELAAVLQEWASPWASRSECCANLIHQVPRSLRGADLQQFRACFGQRGRAEAVDRAPEGQHHLQAGA